MKILKQDYNHQKLEEGRLNSVTEVKHFEPYILLQHHTVHQLVVMNTHVSHATSFSH